MNLKYIMLIILCILINACGFQLRGTGAQSLSDNDIYLTQSQELNTDNNFRAFKKEFTRVLNLSGVNIVTSSAFNIKNNRVVAVDIINLEFSSQGVSRDATGRANEHEVTLRIDYKIPKEVLIEKDSLAIDGTIEIKGTRNERNNNIGNNKKAREALELEDSINTLTVSATYYQDYRNPNAGRIQKNDTHKLLISQLTQSLIRQLEFQLKHK